MALRIVYLPFRAMAEPTRMLLSLGGIAYEDEAVWGTTFQYYKQHELYPFDKTPVMVVMSPTASTTTTTTTTTTTAVASDNNNSNALPTLPTLPTLVAADTGIVVAQSGSLARYAAKLAGRYPTDDDHTACAVSDAIFELGQELCTINPLVNCYSGESFAQVERIYFRDVLPAALPQLEHQLSTLGATLAQQQQQAAAGSGRQAAQSGDGGNYFAGSRASYGDVNIFHMLNNAMLLEPDLLVLRTPTLEDWYWRVSELDGLKQYLEARPTLNGIGEDPGLEDSNGVRVTQRSAPGRAWLVDGCWQLDPL